MILWMILTLLCSAAAVMAAAPFLRNYGHGPVSEGAENQVYRDQLDEIEREAASGQIDDAQAESARVEIRRRLLLSDRGMAAPKPGVTLAGNQMAIVGISGIVVLGSVILYAMSGRPDLPSVSAVRSPHAVATAGAIQPSESRAGGEAQGTSAATTPSGQPSPQNPANGGAALGSVDDMIERIVTRLKQNPDNAEDWRMLGWSYFSTERYPEAADAYGKAAALQPKVASLHASQGEALVRAAQGQITPEIKAILETTLRLDAREPRARFFLGMAKEQAGDKAAALADWTALAADADATEPWLPDLRQRIAELAQQIGVAVPSVAQASQAPPESAATTPPRLRLLEEAEPAKTTIAPTAPPAVSSSAVPRGPTAADVKGAEALSPGDRNAMIRGMVDGLAARLEQSPRDADGWIKLMRSRKVLGEETGASQALKRALEVFSDAPSERAQIVAAAMELQIKP